MRITFHGAAGGVTGSKHLIETRDARVLLDCGLFQGRRKETDRLNRRFDFDPESVDAVVLSHAHIDHIGSLPTLGRLGFRGRIHATGPTAELADIMLHDSAHIQQKDAEFVNKRKRRSRGRHVEPLYTEKDVDALLPRFTPHRLHEWFDVAAGVRVTYRDAGHILGSASVELDVTDGPERRRILFSGDIGSTGRVIIRDPEPAPECDVLLMESTYGNRSHERAADLKGRLADVVGRVVRRGGKVIIPAFSLGRTQHVVYYLGTAMLDGLLPPTDVFVDSPLATRATAVYGRFPDWYDEEARNVRRDNGALLAFDRVRYVRDVEESKSLNDRREPCVIISASGMCEAGRVLHHLRNNIGDPRNAVLIVGFQAAHTLGRRLVEQRSVVKIFGEPHERRAEVVSIQGLSAHADREGLLAWASTLPRSPAHTCLVHGEPDAQEALAAALTERGFRDVRIPERGTTLTV